MTNKQHHRRRRALERFAIHPMLKLVDHEHVARKEAERARLTDLVTRYQAGELRAIHGKGNTRHPSKVAA